MSRGTRWDDGHGATSGFEATSPCQVSARDACATRHPTGSRASDRATRASPNAAFSANDGPYSHGVPQDSSQRVHGCSLAVCICASANAVSTAARDARISVPRVMNGALMSAEHSAGTALRLSDAWGKDG